MLEEGTHASHARILIDQHRRLHAFWVQTDTSGSRLVHVRNADDPLSRPYTLAASEKGIDWQPESNDLHIFNHVLKFSFLSESSHGYPSIHLARLDGTETHVYDTYVRGIYPYFATTPDGVEYLAFVAPPAGTGNGRVYVVRSYDGDGALRWSTPQQIDLSSRLESMPHHPRLFLDLNGQLNLIWSEDVDLDWYSDEIWHSHLDEETSSWSLPQRIHIGQNSSDIRNIHIASTDHQTALVFTQPADSNSWSRELFAMRYDGQFWTPPQSIPELREYYVAFPNLIATQNTLHMVLLRYEKNTPLEQIQESSEMVYMHQVD